MSERSDDVRASMTIPADLRHLADVRRFVREITRREGASTGDTDDLIQAVDECVTNVIVHGYEGTPGSIDVAVVRRADQLAVSVRDGARPFDPTSVPTPDLAAPLETRRPGGMGVHLIRELTDEVVHHPLSPQGNELTMVKRIDPSRGGSDRGDAS